MNAGNQKTRLFDDFLKEQLEDPEFKNETIQQSIR